MKNKMKIIFSVMFFILSTMTGCDESNNYLEIWLSHGITNYSVDQQVICFCLFGDSLFTVYVENDSIVSVMNKATHQPVANVSGFYTINGLFELVDQARDDGAVLLKVNYNKTYGFPEKINIDYSKMNADDEIMINSINLKQILE